MMQGYLNQPALTEAAFTEDGWFRTGDWGYLRSGALTVSDRVKDMVISGGANVYPAEVENVISEIPGVTSVAVVGVPDPYWGQVVWAFVIGSGAELSADDVLARCRSRLASYKVPREIRFVDSFPRSALEKVQKHKLVDLAQSEVTR